MLEATIGYSHTPAMTPRTVGRGKDRSHVQVQEVDAAPERQKFDADFTASMAHGLDSAPSSNIFEPDTPMTYSGDEVDMDALAMDIPEACIQQPSDDAPRCALPPQPIGLEAAKPSASSIGADDVQSGPAAPILLQPHMSLEELPRSSPSERPTPNPRPRMRENRSPSRNIPKTSSLSTCLPSTVMAESRARPISRFIEDSIVPLGQQGKGRGGFGRGETKAAGGTSQVAVERKPKSSQPLPPQRSTPARRMKFDKPPPWEGKEKSKIVPGLQIETPRKIQISAKDLVPSLALSNIKSFVAPPPDPVSPPTINSSTSPAKSLGKETAMVPGLVSSEEQALQEEKHMRDGGRVEESRKSASAAQSLVHELRSPRLLYPKQLIPNTSLGASAAASPARKIKVPVVLATTAANRLESSAAVSSSPAPSAASQRQRQCEALKSPRVLKTTTVWASTDSSASAQITRRDSASTQLAQSEFSSSSSLASRHATACPSAADVRGEQAQGSGKVDGRGPGKMEDHVGMGASVGNDWESEFGGKGPSKSTKAQVSRNREIVAGKAAAKSEALGGRSHLQQPESLQSSPGKKAADDFTPRKKAAMAGFRELVC